MDWVSIPLTTPLIFFPKRNDKWQRKQNELCLKSLCLKAVMKSLINQKPTTAKTLIPKHLLCEIGKCAKKSGLFPKYLLSLLEALPPSTFVEELDFVGKYNGSYKCWKDNHLIWFSAVATDFLMDASILKRLYQLIDGEAESIKKLTLWTPKDAIQLSNFSQIFTKTPTLVSLTLRGDADDHILRIIGQNCPLLKYLDVSRSPKLTPQGLWNLTLQNCNGEDVANAPRNDIVESLNTLILPIEENLETEDIYEFGKIFTGSNYYLKSKGVAYTLEIEKTLIKFENTLQECFKSNLELLQTIEILIPVVQDAVEIDIFESGASEYDIHIFHKETHVLDKSLKVHQELGIVEILDNWDTRKWTGVNSYHMGNLASKVKNLRKLSCRMFGTWDETRGTLFPKLEELYCWCLNDFCVQCILKFSPSLRKVDIKHIPREHGVGLLTHGDLAEVLQFNTGLKSGLEEFMVRPTQLTMDSLLQIQRECPKLERIGDLEFWDVSNEEIEEFNNFLYKSNSQCVLVVNHWPPKV